MDAEAIKDFIIARKEEGEATMRSYVGRRDLNEDEVKDLAMAVATITLSEQILKQFFKL